MFNIGDIIVGMIGAIKSCFLFLKGVSFTALGLTFNLFDFLIAFLILVFVLRLLLPWFDSDDE